MPSKTNRVIRYACERGYYIDLDGRLISPNGTVRKLKGTEFGHFSVTIKYDGLSFPVYVHKTLLPRFIFSLLYYYLGTLGTGIRVGSVGFSIALTSRPYG